MLSVNAVAYFCGAAYINRRALIGRSDADVLLTLSIIIIIIEGHFVLARNASSVIGTVYSPHKGCPLDITRSTYMFYMAVIVIIAS